MLRTCSVLRLPAEPAETRGGDELSWGLATRIDAQSPIICAACAQRSCIGARCVVRVAWSASAEPGSQSGPAQSLARKAGQRRAWLAKRASLQRFAPTSRVLNERRTLHVSRWKLGPRTLQGVRCLVHARVQGRHSTCARFTETAANVLALIRPALSHACQTAHAGIAAVKARVAASSVGPGGSSWREHEPRAGNRRSYRYISRSVGRTSTSVCAMSNGRASAVHVVQNCGATACSAHSLRRRAPACPSAPVGSAGGVWRR
jgi:hypothetical protein